VNTPGKILTVIAILFFISAGFAWHHYLQLAQAINDSHGNNVLETPNPRSLKNLYVAASISAYKAIGLTLGGLLCSLPLLNWIRLGIFKARSKYPA
jgi:hypothetical protein